MWKTQRAQHWALGEASEKRGGVIEAARERLMVHINWGWFVWSTESGCSSQVCRRAGRQMWGPLCPSRANAEQWGDWEMVCPSRMCVCVWGGVEGGQTTCFSFPLISHLLCLDYHFGRRPVRRRCINICSQFARWPRSSMSLLYPDIILFFFCVIPSSYHIIPPGELQGLKTKPSSSMNTYKKSKRNVYLLLAKPLHVLFILSTKQ